MESRTLIQVDQDSILAVRSKAIHRRQEELEMAVKFAPHVKSFFSRDEDENIYYKKDYINLSDQQVLIELEFSVEEGDDEIIALLPQTDIIATGDTIEDAKTNLKQAIYDDYHYLLQHKDTLIERLLAQLNDLEILFQEKE
ncbi:hypothetical protein H8E77_11055 [bacterium]|nr:hypothetical protein [bacterium]